MVEKTEDAKAKANLQPYSKTKEINFMYPKSHRPLVKKDKNNANQEYRDGNKDKDKAKFHNLSSSNSQHQVWASKKNKRHESWQRDLPATGVHITKVAKKDKNKAKDLRYIKCYTCKQKGYHINKYPQKSRN